MPGYMKDRMPDKPRKKRSVKQLHKMWLASLARAEQLTAHTWALMKEVYDTVEPTSSGLRIVYADDYRGQLQYEVYQEAGKKYLSFTRRHRPDETKSRTSFVDAILNQYLDEHRFNLGQRLNDSERASDTYLHKTVFKYFWLALTQSLEKQYKHDKNIPFDENTLIVVNIHKKTYYVGLMRYYSTMEFTWYGEAPQTLTI